MKALGRVLSMMNGSLCRSLPVAFVLVLFRSLRVLCRSALRTRLELTKLQPSFDTMELTHDEFWTLFCVSPGALATRAQMRIWNAAGVWAKDRSGSS